MKIRAKRVKRSQVLNLNLTAKSENLRFEKNGPTDSMSKEIIHQLSSMQFRLPVKLFLVAGAFLCPGSTTGQSTDNQAWIDSLEAVLTKHRPLDKEKVDILNELGYEYWVIDPGRSEEYGAEALEIARIWNAGLHGSGG